MLNRMNAKFEVSVLKSELITKITENKRKHVSLVKEAKEGYLLEAERLLQDKLTRVKRGELSPLAFNLKVPVDRTSEYDAVLEMLEMDQNPSITLTADDFNKLVRDRWDWTNDFLSTNSRYSAMAADLVVGSSFGEF